MSKTKVKEKVSIDCSTSVLPSARILLAVNRNKQDKDDTLTSPIESYKLKLLEDIAQGLWCAAHRTRTLVFNISQHVESHKEKFNLTFPAEMGVEDWDNLDEFLLNFLARELHKEGGYNLFSATNVSEEIELLITWGWYEYDGIVC